MKYKEILTLVQPHFGGSGSTSTMGSIAPELRGLYTSSANALVGQQKDNPLSQYNQSNPLQVAGPNDLQMQAIEQMQKGNQPLGVDSLALQSILRMPGLAAAGPTTGQYDYGQEAGLADYNRFLSPDFNTASIPNVATGAPSPTTNSFSDVTAALAQKSAPAGNGGGVGLPADNGTPPVLPGGNMGGTAPPPARGKAMSELSASDKSRMGGWDKYNTLDDLNAALADKGISASGGGMGGLRLSGGGQSYLNQGGSHEGAGPGGQSKFLSQITGAGSGPGSYGKVAGLDADIAGVAQRMRHAESIGLDPNTSMEDLLKFKSDQRAASPQPGQAGYANSSASWGKAQQAAAQAGPKLTGADRKKK